MHRSEGILKMGGGMTSGRALELDVKSAKVLITMKLELL